MRLVVGTDSDSLPLGIKDKVCAILNSQFLWDLDIFHKKILALGILSNNLYLLMRKKHLSLWFKALHKFVFLSEQVVLLTLGLLLLGLVDYNFCLKYPGKWALVWSN